jgi:hypothetical protein
MTSVLGVAGAVALFVLFGLMRRGREPEACGGSCGSCQSADHCDLSRSGASDVPK